MQRRCRCCSAPWAAPAGRCRAASARDLLRRNLLQQVAGTCKQLPVAWCDASNLRLPQSLAVYPEVSLNQDLYRWLALLAAQAGRCAIGRGTTSAGPRPSSSSSRPCVRVTGAWSRLICSCARTRASCPAEAALERALCQALREPGSVSQFPRSERAPWPLPLWLYPADNLGEPQAAQRAEEGEGNLETPPGGESRQRKRARRVEESSSKGGLLLFRLENLFSWSEHIELDRCGDDTEDLDAARVAEDLDELALSRQRMRQGGGLKLDLDLPAADFDDVPLGEGIKLPEWDYRKQCLQKDFVNLQLMLPVAPRRSRCRCTCRPWRGACAGSSSICATTASGCASNPRVPSWTCRPGSIFTSSGRTASAPSAACSWNSGRIAATWPVCCWPTCRCPPMRTWTTSTG